MSGGTDTWTDRDRTEQEYWLQKSDATMSLRYGWCCSHRHQLCREEWDAPIQWIHPVRPVWIRIWVYVVRACVHWTVCSEIPRNREEETIKVLGEPGADLIWSRAQRCKHARPPTEENPLGLLFLLVLGSEAIRLLLTLKPQKERQTVAHGNHH